ncbi:MAG: hypothetical protein WC208_08275 [Gallionella sp.]|jgi:hypothetical protein
MRVVTYIHKGKVKNVSVDDLIKLKVDLTERWEGICQKCGKCCFDKAVRNGVVVINYDNPCQFLKFIGRKAQCSVYTERFNKCEKCLTVPEVIQKKGLPSSCPYVKAVPLYKAPVDDGQWYKRARIRIAARSRFDDDYSPYASTPNAQYGGQPTEPPIKNTGGLTREDLSKPKEWKRRREALRERIRQHKAVSEGKAGTSDPRQKTEYKINPSGHALGG